MKVYTKTGDKGTTALIGGKRVRKNHQRIEAYGTADELISFLGLLRDYCGEAKHKEFIFKIQNELMVLSAILATDCESTLDKIPGLSKESIETIEKEIDSLEILLPPLKAFVIPGGHPAVSTCHIARTVCRRTERTVLSLAENEVVPDIVIAYLNRLSDYLFVLSRLLTTENHADEIIWKA